MGSQTACSRRSNIPATLTRRPLRNSLLVLFSPSTRTWPASFFREKCRPEIKGRLMPTSFSGLRPTVREQL